MDILRRKAKPQLKPPDTLSRYVVTKHAWYKAYKRIFCITPTAIHTQNPERTLVLTNSYTFVGDSDIESVNLGGDEFEFVISARQDKKSKFKALKFSCKHRQLLLTDLYQCMAAANALGRCLLASKLLGPSQDFQAHKWSRSSSSWKPVVLRVTAFGLEALQPTSGAVQWRVDYHRLSAPGIMTLAAFVPPAGSQAGPQDGVFAVMLRDGRSNPRIFALRGRETLLGQMQQAARKKLAVSIIVDSTGRSSLQELLHAVNVAERTSSSEASELPLGQWEVEALRGRADILPPQLLMASPAQSARKLSVEALAGMADVLVMSGANTVPRRLVVTPSSLITRRVDSHDVVLRRPLTAVAALVRFADDPKLLAVEWEDGAPPCQFVTPARDAVLAALLSAAQAASGRPIAVMPGFTCPGDVIVTDHKHASHAPASEPEPEMTHLYLAELNSRGREVAPCLNGSSMMFYQSHISFSSSPRGSTTQHSPLDSALPATPASAATLSTSPASSTGSSSAAAAAAAKLAAGGSAAAAHLRGRAPEALSPQDAANLMLECVYEFNACVPYAGVSTVGAGEGFELDPQAIAAVLALLPEELQPGLPPPALAPDDVKQAVAVLHCLQRLAGHPLLAEQVLNAPGALGRLWACLGCGADHIVAEGARLLVRLFAPAPARHGAPPWRLLRAAPPLGSEEVYLTNTREDNSLAKTAKMLAFPPSSQVDRLAVLLKPLAAQPPMSHLTSMALLEAVAAVAVDPGARTTDPSLQDAVLQAAAALGRPLFALFNHPASRVADGTAVIMRAIAECGASAAAPMRDAALREGAILHHLQLALFASGDKAKLSQELVASWADSYAPALTLMQHIFPPGLVRYLNAPKPAAELKQQQQQQQQLLQQQRAAAASQSPPAAVQGMSAISTSPAGTVPTTAPAAMSASPAAAAATAAAAGVGAATPGQPALGPGQQQQQMQQGLPSAPAGGAAVSPAAPAAAGAAGTTAAAAAAASQNAAMGGAAPAAHAVSPAAAGAGVGPVANGNASYAVSGGSLPVQQTEQQLLQQQQPAQQQPTVQQVTPGQARQLPQSVGGLKGNWPAFWTAASKDHCHAGLIWNESTRRELRDALEREEAGLRAARTRVAKGGGGWPSWNWEEFGVSYPSLGNQLCIGGVYVRLLLEGGDATAVQKLANPKEFFTACYHALLCCTDTTGSDAAASSDVNSSSSSSSTSGGSTKASSNTDKITQQLCVKAMAAAYSAHAGTIGPFEGIPHLLQLLDTTPQRSLRHGLLLLVQALVAPKAAGDLSVLSAPPDAATTSSLPNVAGASSSSSKAAALSVNTAGASKAATTAAAGAPGSTAAAGQGVKLSQLPPAQAAAVKAAKANGYLLMDHSGLQLLVDFVAGAHECTERRMAAAAAGTAGAAAAGAGHLITSISHAEAPKEWSFYPNGYHPERSNKAGTAAAAAAADSAPAGAPAAPSTSYTVGDETVPGPDETGRAGPMSKDALRQLHTKGVISSSTWVWAAGMQAPQQLGRVRELRWMLSSGLGLLGPFDAALVALQVLQQLASLQPAVDEEGSVLQPLPRAHRGIADPACLPHIAQVMLTGEPALVSAAAKLLTTVLAHNGPALSQLYLSGAFIFGLAYCGSNLAELAELFKVAHLVQGFRGPAELLAGLPLVQRSYLGVLLPESLLHMLESYGPGVFAAALSGDHNTPEIVWTAAMRQQRLIPAMLQHLGDFPHRLSQHCHAVYEYTPPPPMSWPELADEIWCHRYYLANLCDEDRFRNWPVVEHIPLLQALMEQWRAELQRKPLSMSEGQACEALGLTPGPDGRVEEDDMRRAYRMLARRYHPDKNPSPEARAKFLQVQKAYERLQAGAAGGQGPQPWRLLLMLRAQCILFRRYAAVLAPFKYAGYPQLLEVLRQQQVAADGAGSGGARASTAAAAGAGAAGAAAAEQGGGVQQAPGGGNVSVSSSSSSTSGHFLSGERISQVLAAIELCWLTCVASRRNAEELLRSGGLPLLAGLLTRCVGILPSDVAPLAAEAVITTHTLRTLAGLAAVDAARRDMEGQPQLLADIVKCCSLERAPAAVDAAIVAICYLAASPKLQHMLLESGALAVLIPLLLQYDVTLSAEASARLQLPFTTAISSNTAAAGMGADGVQQPGLGPEASGLRLLDMALVRPNMQEARSQHALLAAQALARLAGMLRDPFHTPANQPAQAALSALLTQSLSARLAESDPRPLLVCLNSSMETAQVIWNSGMREELLKALSAQRSRGTDLSALQSFSYSSLQGELQVGGVFIRVFNQRGRSSANASNATVTAATATAAVAAGPATTAPGTHAGPLSTQHHPQQQQQQRVSGGGAAAFAGPGGSGIPSDPAGFCKALVRYLYDRLVERCFRGAELQQLSAPEARNALDVVTALSGLLENEPRLLGLLSSKSALSPLVACITPAAATWPPLFEQAAAAGISTGSRGSTDAAAATTAAVDGADATAGSIDSANSASSTDTARLAETAEQLAFLGLQLLLRATANAAVQEALTDEALLRQLYWLCVQPPSGRVLNAALALLRRLSSSPLAASVGGYQGGAVMLMSVLLHTGRWPWPGGDAPAAALAEQTDAAKAAAADVLGALMAQPSHGPRVSLLMGKLLPPGLVASIAEGPPAAVLRALGQTVETPECMWDSRMAAQAAAEVASLAAAVRQQHAGGSYDWSPPTGYQLEYDSLRGEVYVGGVYVRLFLKNPKYAVRDPVKFAEALVEKYLQELTAAAAAANSGAATAAASLDQCLLLSAAAVALLQGHGLLADHVAQLGSSGRLLTNLAARTARIPARPPDLPQHQQHRVPPDELGGSILRLLHQLAASTGAAEAMAASTNAPVVPTLLPAMAWGHGASILVLETLKRALSPANRQRDSLVAQALQAGLVQKLLLLLDWRSGEAAADGSSMTQAQEQELAVERTLAVDVLRSLADEGSYSAQVNATLSQSPVWAAYRDQRHDMFLPSGATAETGVVGLLTAGDTARFALPAPESVQGTTSTPTAGQQGAQ